MKRHRPILLLALLLALVASGASWIRDDAGLSSAQCAFIGSNGLPTLCSTTDPLPTSASGPATTSSTDPTGWGQTWFIGSATGATQIYKLIPIPLAENDYIGFAKADVGNSIDVWKSNDKGRTWTRKIASLSFSAVTNIGVTQALALTDGSYLVSYACGASTTPGCTGLGRIAPNGTAAQVALPGIPAATTTIGGSIHQQGNTVIYIFVEGATAIAFQCRSTDTGATFSCDAVNYSTLFATFGKSLASPSTGVWLRGTAAGLERSVNDGASYTAVLAGAAGTARVVECLSPTVCLFTNGQQSIWRSADAGATWAQVFSTPDTNPLFLGILDYGEGVAALVPSTPSRNLWLTRDSGVSWTAVFSFGAAPQACSSPCQVGTISGSGVFSVTPTVNTDKVMYNPTIGQGTFQIVGTGGVPLAIDSSGRLTANQGARAANAPGQGWWVNGVLPTFLTQTRACAQPAANTAAVVTITGVAGQVIGVFRYNAYFSGAAPAAPITLNIVEGATTVWLDQVAGLLIPTFRDLGAGYTSGTGNTVTVTLPAGGAGVSGVLCVHAGQITP